MKRVNCNLSKSEKGIKVLTEKEKAKELSEIDSLIEELKIEEKEFQDWMNELKMQGREFPDSFPIELADRNEAYEMLMKVTLLIKSKLQE